MSRRRNSSGKKPGTGRPKGTSRAMWISMNRNRIKVLVFGRTVHHGWRSVW